MKTKCCLISCHTGTYLREPHIIGNSVLGMKCRVTAVLFWICVSYHLCQWTH